eukprot:g278.t1 g278   contig1:683452-683991(+)
MPRRSSAAAVSNSFSDDDETNTQGNYGGGGAMSQLSQMQFSQLLPDRSQRIDTAKPNEIKKLSSMEPTARNRIVTDLSRILLFKALNGDVIDRKKVIAEALGDMKGERVQAAVLSEAQKRLKDVFGFEVCKVPAKMEDNLPTRFKDRLYLINNVADDDMGTHSINIHSAHADSCVEKEY